MIVNSTLVLRHQESSATPFVFSSTSIAITNPDGTALSGVVTGANNTTPAVSQIATAQVTPTQGGIYKVAWTLGVGSEIVQRPETHFAFWTDVPRLIRRRLQTNDTDLPDSEIEPEFALMIQRLMGRFSGYFTAYNALTGMDQDRMDAGAALLVAVLLRGLKAKKTPAGDVTGVKIGTNIEYRFAPPITGKQTSVTEDWIREAEVIFGQITFLKARFDALRTGINAWHTFRIDGPTRHRRDTGQRDSMMSIIMQILTDNESSLGWWSR